MSADEALFDGHPVAHIVTFRERQRRARILQTMQGALRAARALRRWP